MRTTEGGWCLRRVPGFWFGPRPHTPAQRVDKPRECKGIRMSKNMQGHAMHEHDDRPTADSVVILQSLLLLLVCALVFLLSLFPDDAPWRVKQTENSLNHPRGTMTPW